MNPNTASPDVVACRRPALEAFENGIAPIGNLLALGFVTLWALVSAFFLADRYAWDRAGHVAEAMVVDASVVRYVDADGQTREALPPARKGWRPRPGERLSILYRDDRDQVESAERHPSQLRIAWIMMLLALPMYAGVYWAHRTVQAHRRRLARLAELDLRQRASAWRVVDARGKKGRQEYRLAATFEHGGRRYEALSDRYAEDPSPDFDPERLRVWLDPADPRLSLVAPDTVPSRSEQQRAALARLRQRLDEARGRR
jgi:hypothetical protein